MSSLDAVHLRVAGIMMHPSGYPRDYRAKLTEQYLQVRVLTLLLLRVSWLTEQLLRVRRCQLPFLNLRGCQV